VANNLGFGVVDEEVGLGVGVSVPGAAVAAAGGGGGGEGEGGPLLSASPSDWLLMEQPALL
jgi:hypothetical protein